MKEQKYQEEEIFHQALERAPGEERDAWLEEACGGDSDLRFSVEELLQAHEEPASLLGNTAAGIGSSNVGGGGEKEGDIFGGRYRLIEKIGRGGMGTVWLAEQSDPVRRKVALKIIKLGMDTREVVARFEAERQALAMMDHPGIAKVYDAGSTAQGRPYFVMELVEGLPLTRFCDERRLDTRDRLVLFIEVCKAVQHAHQKGVIHRDIKPTNILVTEQDGCPVAKVIDFGVAKATGEKLTQHTLMTGLGGVLGTLGYMSPEQAGGEKDIDTRSDIYSLGVVLYELLAGVTPFRAKRLREAAFDVALKMIREEDPLKPSTQLSHLGEASAEVAAQRSTEIRKLARTLSGDLDWIVMRALEKDRDRRYETANAFARDVERYLGNEAITAGRPSAGYRLRKFVRRNRTAFTVASAIAVALIAGAGLAMVSFFSERQARANEAEQRMIADEQRGRAQLRTNEAQASELKARRFLYAADMNLVQYSLRLNNIGRARLLLDRHRPATGELDVRGWEWRYLWQQCRSGSLALLTKRDGVRALSVSFSPDDAWLAVGYSDGQVELWDVEKRERAKVIQEPFGMQAHVAFSPQGNVLAATMGPHTVKAYDLASEESTVLCSVWGYVRDLSFSPDGEFLAVVENSPESVHVLRVADPKLVMTHRWRNFGDKHFNNARFSPNKERLYLSCGARQDPRVRCVRVPGGEVIWELTASQIDGFSVDVEVNPGFSAMAISPDGRFLTIAGGYGEPTAMVLDAETGELIKTLSGHTGWIRELAFSRDGKTLVTASADQTMRLWDTATWKSSSDPLRGHSQEVAAVAFTNDGRFLASGSKDGEVFLWDSMATRPENGRQDVPAEVRELITLPTGQSVLAKDLSQKWSLLDLATFSGEELPQSEISTKSGMPLLTPVKRKPWSEQEKILRAGLTGTLSDPAVSPDHRFIAVASEDGFVGLNKAYQHEPVEMIRGNAGAVFDVTFSPDNRRLILASGGSVGIEVWDVEIKQVLITLSSPKQLLRDVQFTGDGNTLFAGSNQTDGSNQATGLNQLQREGHSTWEFWRAPSWEEIADAENTGGRWPPAVSFPPTPPAPTLKEIKFRIEEKYREILEQASVQTPPNFFQLIHALADYAGILRLGGRVPESDPLVSKSRELSARLCGEVFPSHSRGLKEFSKLQLELGELEVAEALALEWLTVEKELHGGEHLHIAECHDFLGSVLGQRGILEEAEDHRRASLVVYRKLVGEDHPDIKSSLESLVEVLEAQGKTPEIQKLYDSTFQLRLGSLGRDATDTVKIGEKLFMLHALNGDREEALGILDGLAARPLIANESPRIFRTGLYFAYFDEKARHREFSRRMLDANAKTEDFHTAGRTAVAIATYRHVPRDQAEESVILARKALALSPNDRLNERMQCTYGMALVRAGRYSEAKVPLEIAKDSNIFLCSGQAHALLAISAFHLKENGEGRDHLARAEVVTGLFAGSDHPENLLIDTNKLAAWLVIQEARELISGGTGQPMTPILKMAVVPVAEWRWLNPIDGVDPQDSVPDFHKRFFLPDFDDSSWRIGRDQLGETGGFGYGKEGFTGVEIGTPEKGNRHSAYFRHTFKTRKTYSNLELRCQFEGGIIVYLDGKEVTRSNIVGEDSYRLTASDAIEGAEETKIRSFLIGGELPPGEHVLAISLHNSSAASSDLRIGEITLVELAKEN
jgi:WD40 repeat protein/tetratricopeptide (TPR) repeat protein